MQTFLVFSSIYLWQQLHNWTCFDQELDQMTPEVYPNLNYSVTLIKFLLQCKRNILHFAGRGKVFY